MFAFAIWDAPKRRLLLVRDRLGIKPLYWARVGRPLLFGSEIKAHARERADRSRSRTTRRCPRCSARATSPGAETMFRGIHKLLPGHQLVFENGRGRASAQYWDIPARDTTRDVRERLTDAIRSSCERFRELLEESVRLRLMSDVPLGMFLSGGIDSSAIAALMARHDRSSAADVLGRVQGAGVQRARIRARGRRASAPTRTKSSSTSATSSARCRSWCGTRTSRSRTRRACRSISSRRSRAQHVTVVLTGEGSDELLAGYGKYPRIALELARRRDLRADACRAPSARRIARAVVPTAAAAGSAAMRRDRFWRWTRRRRRCSSTTSPRSGSPISSGCSPPACARSATPTRAYGASIARTSTPPNGASTLLDRLLYADIKTYLVELLMKQDQMSMAASIESRVPFLDHKLVEFAATLPDEMEAVGLDDQARPARSDEGRSARIDSEPAEDGLPGAVRARGRAARWNGVVARRAARSPDARARHHRSRAPSNGCSPTTRPGADRRRRRIWSLLNLELWYRTFIDGEGMQTLPGNLRRPRSRRCACHAHPLAEVGPAAAARQGRQAADVASDAPPRARHEITYLAFADPAQPPADVDGMREVAVRVENRSAHAIRRRGRCASTLDAARHLVDPLPYAVAQVPLARVPPQAPRRCCSQRPFDLIVCDFPVAGGEPAATGCRARRCSSRTTSNRRSGGGTRRRQTGRVAALLYATQYRRMLPLRSGTRSRASTACSPYPTPIARRSRACIPAPLREPIHVVPTGVDTSLLRADRRVPIAASRRLWSSPARWTGCRTRTRCCSSAATILPLIRAEEPDVTLSIVGRAPTPAVQRLAADAASRSPAASTTCGRTCATRRSTSCRCESAAARG